MSDRRTRHSVASRLSALAVGAALVAALLVPMIVMVLAGASLDARTFDGHAAGDAAGTASAAVGGAQRLLAGGRDAIPVALPISSRSVLAPIDTRGAAAAMFELGSLHIASGDAAATAEASRKF